MQKRAHHLFWPAPGRRRGVALLMVLAVTMILTGATLSFLRTAHLEARVSENTQALSQAEIIAQAGLKAALALIATDDPGFDDEADVWWEFGPKAAAVGALFEGGGISPDPAATFIKDLSACLNLNNLVQAQDPDKVDEKFLAVVGRLFTELGRDVSLANAVVDWIDANDNARAPGGAENYNYLALEDPYPAANTPLMSRGQLMLVAGFDREVLVGEEEEPGLLPYLAAGPAGPNQVNINTASAPVIRALSEKMTEELVQRIISNRPYANIQEVKARTQETEVYNEIKDLIGVKSSLFLVRVQAFFGADESAAVALATGVAFREGDKGVRLLYFKFG